MLEAILGAMVVMMLSLLGVVFTFGVAKIWFDKNLPFLVSLAGGVFLVTAITLAREAVEIAPVWWQGVGLIVLGYGLALGFHKLLPETHHHHGINCQQTHRQAKKLIVGDIIHNVADGIVLAGAFSASVALGLGVLLSIMVHEALQEVSEFFVIRQAGYSIKQTLVINFAVSSSILLGVGLGYFTLVSPEFEMSLLALSAGFFFNVVFSDLMPKPAKYDTNLIWLKQLLMVLGGVLIMVAIQWLVGVA